MAESIQRLIGEIADLDNRFSARLSNVGLGERGEMLADVRRRLAYCGTVLICRQSLDNSQGTARGE